MSWRFVPLTNSRSVGTGALIAAMVFSCGSGCRSTIATEPGRPSRCSVRAACSTIGRTWAQ